MVLPGLPQQTGLPWPSASLTKGEARAVKIWALLLLLACTQGSG